MNPPTLNARASARPLVLMIAFAYGLATRHSAVWVAAGLLAMAEGFWWAAQVRTSNGRQLPPPVIVAAGLLAWPLGVLRWGAWLLCLTAEWIARPALWDGGIMTHARQRRASRKARKIRGHVDHAQTEADVLALASAAAQAEEGKPRRRRLRKLPPPPAPIPASAEVRQAEAVGMRFAQCVIHDMADGTQRFEEMPS